MKRLKTTLKRLYARALENPATTLAGAVVFGIAVYQALTHQLTAMQVLEVAAGLGLIASADAR